MVIYNYMSDLGVKYPFVVLWEIFGRHETPNTRHYHP